MSINKINSKRLLNQSIVLGIQPNNDDVGEGEIRRRRDQSSTAEVGISDGPRLDL